MIAIRLQPDLERRLARLSRRTGLTKTSYVRAALLEHLSALEAGHLSAAPAPARKRGAKAAARTPDFRARLKAQYGRRQAADSQAVLAELRADRF